MNVQPFGKIYFDVSHPLGFVGKKRFISQKHKDRALVSNWLDRQSAYNKHRPVRQHFLRRPYTVSNIDDYWEADLVDLKMLKTYNKNYTFLLTVIDCFSRFAWVEPIKDKSSKSVIRAFTKILKRSEPRQCVFLQTDRGREFCNGEFQEFLKEKDIKFRLVRNPEIKCAIVERFHRTLKSRMFRYFTHTRTKTYIDVLESLVTSYNNSLHSSLGLTPAEVTVDTAAKVREKMIERQSKIPYRTVKYAVNDLVRISKQKDVFRKGYESGYTDEVFVIVHVARQRLPTVYEVADLSGEEVDGIFYTEELSSVGVKLPTEPLEINKIIEVSGRGKSKRALVTWKGLPEDCVSWVLQSNIQDEI